MTALQALCNPKEGIVFCTDGGGFIYGRAELSQLVNKVIGLVELPCMIASRGPGELLPLIYGRIYGRHVDFDECLAELGGVLRDIYSTGFLAKPFVHAEILVGGWSRIRGQYETYGLVSHDLWTANGYRPWAPMPLGTFYAAPYPERADLEALQFDVDERGDALGVGQADMVRFMEAQRRRVIPSETSSCLATGFAQLTVLTRDRISTEIVHRWPDELGKPIDRDRRQ